MAKKKALCLLLSLVMVFSLLPVSALAAKARSATEYGDIVGESTGGAFTDETANPNKAYEYTIVGSDGSIATVAAPLADDEGDTNATVEQINSYVRVTSIDEITNGIYVMTGARSGYNLNKAILSDTSYSAALDVSADGVITSTITDTYLWTITAVEGDYTIQNSGSQYLYIYQSNEGSVNAVQTRSDTYTMTIEKASALADSFYIGGPATAENDNATGYLNHRSEYPDGISTWTGKDIGSCIYLYKYVTGYRVTDAAIADATSGVQGKIYYTTDSYAAYKAALADAKEIYETNDEAVAAYNALVAAVDALEDSGLEAVTFNTKNNNISWQRTADTEGNYVARVSYVNDADDYVSNLVTYPQYTALTWNWSELSSLINNEDTRVENVWSIQSDGMSACLFSANSDGWTTEDFYKISGTFTWPEDYDLSDTTISIASVNDDAYNEIYDYIEKYNLSSYFDGNVIPVNDDVYVVMWVDDGSNSITSDNINNYLLFWTGTSGKGIWTQSGNISNDWNRTTPATFISAMKQGVRAFRNAWPNAVGVEDGLLNQDVQNYDFPYLTHTDGWYTITDTSAINSVIRNNYSSIDAGATVHLDLYVANNDGEGMIDELEVTLAKKKVTEADVTVMYYYDTVDDSTYLGQSVLTNQTIGSTITLTGGTNASQLDYLKSAATAATKKEMNSGIQMNNLTVQKDSSQNIIRVLYTAGDAKVITLTAATASLEYTGNPTMLNEVTVTETGYSDTGTTTNGTYMLPDGNTLKNAISVVTKTDPGIYENDFTDANGNTLTYVVENIAGQQITDTYTIITVPGTLTITYAPEPVTYTYDFGVTNKYADTLNAVEQKAEVTESSDEVEVSGADVTYTPAAADTGDSVDLTLTFTGNYQVTKNVTFVPATNVLYEENLVTNGTDWALTSEKAPDLPVVDDNDSTVYGYTDIDAYAMSEGFSNGSAYKAELPLTAGTTTTKTETAASFTFTGTGFDLISECGTDTGMLLVKVSDSNGKAVAAYLVDTYFTGDGTVIDAETSEKSILDYQVPVLRNMELPYGTYKVEVYGCLVNTAGAATAAASTGYSLKKRGVGTAASSIAVSQTDIISAVLDDFEFDDIDAADVQVSFMDENSVLNGGTGNTNVSGSAVASFALSRSTYTTASGSATAYVYLDAFRVYKPLETDAEIYTTDGEDDVKYASIYDFIKNSVIDLDDWVDNAFVYVEYDGDTETAAIADYKIQGPQNEVYLTPGSGIAFALENYEEGDVVQLAMKSVGTIDATANEATDMSATSATEMYYEVPVEYDEDLGVNYVVITNNEGSTGILALSGLKLSSHITAMGSEALGERVIAKLDKTSEAEFVPKLLTASAPSSVKSGRNATISIESSTDDVATVKLFIDNEDPESGDGITLNPTNTKSVAAGKSDVYKYSYVVKTTTLNLSAGDHTFTVYAYDTEGNQSAPVTVTITVTQ